MEEIAEFPKIPKEIVFPDELNAFLREQLRYYVHENGMLKKQITENELSCTEKQQKITKLETKLKSYNNNEFVSVTQCASGKIVELSKKLREKNAEIETLKTKFTNLQKYAYELEKQSEQQFSEPVQIIREEKPENHDDEIKKITEKLNATTTKLIECRNTNTQLKNDLKLANKFLQQEIGETFDNLRSNHGWRGRAQIICDLQQKNIELRDKLKSQQHRSNPSVDVTKTNSKISVLSKENDDLKTNYDEQKKKHDASRARCKVLENECNSLKAKLAAIENQSENDQNVIATLQTQINNFKDVKNDLLKEKDSIINQLRTEKQEISNLVEHYKTILKSKTDKIVIKPQPKPEKNDEKILKRLEAEKIRLLELYEVQNKRIETDRAALDKTQSLLRLEKQKSAKLEAAVARMELESNATNRSAYSKFPSCNTLTSEDTLKDQLELAEETVKSLKTRLEIEQHERKIDFREFSKILQGYDDK